MDELLRNIERATSGNFSEDYAPADLLRLLSAAEDALKAGQPPTTTDSTSRFDAFRAALDALCTRHGVQLTVSGYDGLQVWPLRKGEAPVHANGFENCIPDRPNDQGNLPATRGPQEKR